jgi:UDP-N-acetylmuramate--alanine ligase
VLCPIYAARETDTLGVSSAQLAALIPGAEAADSLEDAAKRLEHLVQPGDLVFTMGAGDVVKIAGMLEE